MPQTQVLELDDVTLVVEVHGAGPLVVLAHGFPDCLRSFRHQAPALVAAGYSAALVAMRGYAPSSPSRSGRYDAEALGRDLLAVGDALSPERPFALVGHDWGAIACQAAAGLAPSRITALATMAVPHLRVALPRFLRPAQLRRSLYMLEFQPRRATAAVRADDFDRIEALWRRWSPGYRATADEMTDIKNAIGPHLDAVLGYYRALFRPGIATLRCLLAKTLPPALYLHGRDDGCIGVELARGLERAYAGGLEVGLIGGVGHFLHLERPDEVNTRLVRFLRTHHD
ncbi:MAG: alpha/beta hydrolase [Deltaproteobacteria bacterium]|nr:alpha/beta hydrolase [Deltaproteobacteria bacterium]